MSIDFSRNYAPPGVYIDEIETSMVSSTGIVPTLVAICGPTRGYQIHTEQVPFGATPVSLAKKGIDLNTVVLTVVSDGTEIPGANFSTAKTQDLGGQDYQTQVLETAGNTLDDPTAVFVTYHYTDPTYFEPKRVSNFEDVKDLYGEPVNLETEDPTDPEPYQYVLSPLSLAAKVAFENGASDLVLVSATAPPPSATTESQKSAARRTALAAAYEKTSTLNSVNVLVGVTTGIATADAAGALTDLSNHARTAADDGFYRFCITGFDPAVTTAPDALIASAAVKNRRIMLAYAGPGAVLMYSSGTNSTFAVGHSILAAAYAGRMESLPVQQSLTKQPIASFSGLGGTPLSNALKNQYATEGVAIAEVDRLSRLVVRHAVTTDPTNVNTRESAVVRARDALVSLVQTGTSDSGLVGQPIDDELLLSVKSFLQGMLESAVIDGVIVSYTELAVRQVSTDPSVIEVKFAYRPAYPLNYILISFSIDMSTGVTDLTTTETAA